MQLSDNLPAGQLVLTVATRLVSYAAADATAAGAVV